MHGVGHHARAVRFRWQRSLLGWGAQAPPPLLSSFFSLCAGVVLGLPVQGSPKRQAQACDAGSSMESDTVDLLSRNSLAIVPASGLLA